MTLPDLIGVPAGLAAFAVAYVVMWQRFMRGRLW